MRVTPSSASGGREPGFHRHQRASATSSLRDATSGHHRARSAIRRRRWRGSRNAVAASPSPRPDRLRLCSDPTQPRLVAGEHELYAVRNVFIRDRVQGNDRAGQRLRRRRAGERPQAPGRAVVTGWSLRGLSTPTRSNLASGRTTTRCHGTSLVRDRQELDDRTGQRVDSAGNQANGLSQAAQISADGQLVFSSPTPPTWWRTTRTPTATSSFTTEVPARRVGSASMTRTTRSRPAAEPRARRSAQTVGSSCSPASPVTSQAASDSKRPTCVTASSRPRNGSVSRTRTRWATAAGASAPSATGSATTVGSSSSPPALAHGPP